MKLLLITDAWFPQTNGVVTTLSCVIERLPSLGVTPSVIHPGLFSSVGLPGYREIPLVINLWRLPAMVRELDPDFKPGDVERYLGVMNTLRPPALGGKFDKGRGHFEHSIALSGGRDLGAKVDFARYYARTLYEQELHDRLLNEVLAADPVEPGRTLFNTLAQRDARALLESGADYF